MKRHALPVVLILLTAALTPGRALADSSNPAPWQQRFQQHLGLTDDQMTQIREIWQRQRDQGRQVWQALARAQQELRQLALGGADEAAIQAKAAEVEGLYSQALQLRVNTLREMAPLLTDEQRQKLAETPGPRWHHRHRAPAPQS